MKLHTLTINVIVRLSANVLWADNSQIHKIFCIAPLSHQGFLKGWCDKNFYLVKSITLLFASVNLNVHKKHCKPHACTHICTRCKAHVCGHGNFWLYYKTCISMVAGCFCCFQGVSVKRESPDRYFANPKHETKTGCVVTSQSSMLLTLLKDCNYWFFIWLVSAFRNRHILNDNIIYYYYVYRKKLIKQYEDDDTVSTHRKLNITHIIIPR